MTKRFAHSVSPGNREDWQSLDEHLLAVADLSARRAQGFGLERTARMAGLFHDLGKYDPEFDRVLCGETLRVDHSTAGGRILQDRAAGTDAFVAQALAYCILGHHAGLPDGDTASDSCLKRRLERFQVRLDPVWETEVPVDFSGALAEL